MMHPADIRRDAFRRDMDRLVDAARREAIAACRAAVEKQLIHGALSLQGKSAMEQSDAVLAAIDAVGAS